MRMEIAVNIHEPLQKVLRIATIASNNGFDRVWIIDFPGTRLSSVVAAALAEENIPCRLGLGLLSPFLYDVQQIVRFVDTLSSKYGDSFDMLIGPGDRGMLNRIGIPFKTKGLIERMRQFIDELKVEIDKRGLSSSVFVGAQGPKMISLSMHADGVLLNYTEPEMILWAMSLLQEASKGFQIGVFPPTNVSDDECKDNISFMHSAAVIALGLTKSVASRFGLLDRIGPAKEALRLHGGITQEVIDLIPKDVLARFGLCGNEGDILQYIERLSKCSVDIVVFGPPVGASKTQTERLAKAISDFSQ